MYLGIETNVAQEYAKNFYFSGEHAHLTLKLKNTRPAPVKGTLFFHWKYGGGGVLGKTIPVSVALEPGESSTTRVEVGPLAMAGEVYGGLIDTGDPAEGASLSVPEAEKRGLSTLQVLFSFSVVDRARYEDEQVRFVVLAIIATVAAVFAFLAVLGSTGHL